MDDKAVYAIAQQITACLLPALAKAMYPIHERIVKKPAAAGTNYLDTKVVEPGRLQFITRIAVINKTTGYTRLRVMIRDKQELLMWEEDTPTTANQLFWTNDLMILREGQQLRAELTGVTAGDEIEMAVNGYWVEVR